jgi:hypothetical protein
MPFVEKQRGVLLPQGALSGLATQLPIAISPLSTCAGALLAQSLGGELSSKP